MIRPLSALALIIVALGGGVMAMAPLGAPGSDEFAGAEDARQALVVARQQQRNARARGIQLERQAEQSQEAADKAVQQAAALAARVQQEEAAIAAAQARYALAKSQRRALDIRLAERREPLARLTGALQSISRRPMILSAFKPGSLHDLVHTRAVLDSTIPHVRASTAGLRDALAEARALESEERRALAARRQSEAALIEKRKQLVAAAERDRLIAQQAAGGANRESQRAMVLAEQARDLDTLVGQLEQAGSLRKQLAALPGPILRPDDPETAVVSASPTPLPSATAPPARYILPVTGQVLKGFGEGGAGGPRTTGIALRTRPGAQVVAPGAGRIAFAGPYRGFGSIVIIEHANGWTSLVTGLGALDASVGQMLAAGSPLGLAATQEPSVMLELRREGTPVNPLDYLQ